MNSIREQFQAEKDAYRVAQYPGDLAADLLPRRTSSWWIGALGAVAAMIVIAVDLYPITKSARPTPTPIVAMVTTKSTPPSEASLWTPPTMSAVSMSSVASMPSIGEMPSMPSMPSGTSMAFPDSQNSPVVP